MTTPHVLDGRYVVGEVIGRGATARVHRGQDLRSGRCVAIKLLHAELAQDPLFRSRFRREAQTMASLRHAAIASLFDAGHVEVCGYPSGTVRVPYIVMEHVDGWSLRDLLNAGGLTVAKSLQYQLGVLAALEFSHRAGVLHRDIKPGNVMITARGAVKLVDFGIASCGGDSAATRTHTQVCLGTPAYLAPERARGEIADVRSDIYSAGCLLYELLTGRPPFTGDDPVAVAYQHVHDRPPAVGTTVPALDFVLAKALAKAQEDRFQDARAFAEALQLAARGLVPLDDGGTDPGGLEHLAPSAVEPRAVPTRVTAGVPRVAC
jgi:serine/threonine protein kinase